MWFFFEDNDIMPDLIREAKNPLMLRYLDDDFRQGLMGIQPEIDKFLTEIADERVKKKERYLREHPERFDDYWKLRHKPKQPQLKIRDIIYLQELRKRFQEILQVPRLSRQQPMKSDQKKAFILFQKILVYTNEYVSRWGGKLYFVYLPSSDRYMLSPSSPPFPYRNHILQIVQKERIPIIDMHDIFINLDDPKSIFPIVPRHYNEKGYKLIADEVLVEISK